MTLEDAMEALIKDWRSRPSPKASSPTYLVSLAENNERLKCALELESELKIIRAEKLLRRK